MPNNDPIYGRIYRAGIGLRLTTGFSSRDGSNATLLLTADPINGSYLRRLQLMPAGINVQSLLLVYKAVAGANFRLIRDWAMPASGLSGTISSLPQDILLMLGLGPSEQIWVQLATTVAAGIDVTSELMDF